MVWSKEHATLGGCMADRGLCRLYKCSTRCTTASEANTEHASTPFTRYVVFFACFIMIQCQSCLQHAFRLRRSVIRATAVEVQWSLLCCVTLKAAF